MVAQEKWKVAIVGQSVTRHSVRLVRKASSHPFDQPLKFCPDDSDTRYNALPLAGSGNWGSAIAHLVGKNVKERSDRFETEVDMWCFEEEVRRRALSLVGTPLGKTDNRRQLAQWKQFEGRKLTEIINEKHENVKYLPGITLGDNIIAEPDLPKAIEGANALIFVLPHQVCARTGADTIIMRSG